MPTLQRLLSLRLLSFRGRPAAEPAGRLDRLVARARAADLWERGWRGLIPPLVVAGAFLCVSWLGLWLVAPHWARLGGVVLFAMGFALSTIGLWRLAPASRRDALRRIDRATGRESGLAHRPASTLADTLATGGHDPATDALWALHRRRTEATAAALRAGAPSPRAAEVDRYALRGAILVALVACAVVAGPQRYARVAAAFDFGLGSAAAPDARTDAWIDPPPYTGKAPVLLDLAAAAARDPAQPMAIAAPIGSTVIVRSSGGAAPLIETSGPLLPPAPPKAAANGGEGGKADSAADAKPDTKPDAKQAAAPDGPAPGDSETRLVLHGDSRLTLRRGSRLLGAFAITAIPDAPPQIALRELPKGNARGTLTLFTTASDDYGVNSAEARFSDPRINGEPLAGPALVEAPHAALALPGSSRGIGDAESTIDLSDSPYAGTEVTMVLVARDEGGNEGRSEPYTLTLPQKPFNNPLARALVEQRRILALEPGRRSQVAIAIESLMLDPETYGTGANIYLGLRFAADELARARSKPQLVAVADYLWGMALLIENGDLSEAEKALRDAEKALRDAIDRHASADEIAKLTDNLQAAMDKFLKELAQQQDKQGEQQQADRGRPSKSISANDLQKLIERLKEQARSGNREEAKKALDELQDILENLKTAKRQKADPQAKAMAQSLNQLDQMMRDQQELRDETFKREQGDGETQGRSSPGRGGQRQPGRQGMNGQGRGGQSQGRQGKGGQSGGQGQQSAGGQDGGQGAGEGDNGEQPGGSLEERQKALRDRLAAIQKKLKEVGQGERALGDAGQDMQEAEEALKEGDGANGQAVDAQGRALDALQKGAKKLSEAMKQQDGEAPGNGQSNAQGEGSQEGQEGQQSADSDPLGRPRGGDNMLNSTARFDPLGVPAAQRAQRVLEELRRRLGDPSRAREEIDYLERLLRSY